jgi:hypothetical protein
MPSADRLRLVLAILIAAAAGGGLAVLAIYGTGVYGVTLFAGVPLFVGFATTTLLGAGRPRTLPACFGWSCAATVLLGFGLLVTGREGLLCLVMLVPLALPLVGVGTLAGWWLVHARRLRRGGLTVTIAALILAGLIAGEGSIRPSTSSKVWVAADEVMVEASPARVWGTIVTLGDLAPSDDLIFKVGAACPQRTRIVTQAEGGLRVCTLSTGTLLERIDRWEPGRRLAWEALSTPPPMKELNPFRDADPPHLHGFYRNVRGEFELTPAGPGRTRLTRRTWYQYDMYPAGYWRWWCDLGASRVHRFVLEHVKRESERRGGRTI